MVVCHCRAVTDGTIRAAIQAGATTVSQLARCCRAGSGCGGCCAALRQLLAEYGRGVAATTQAGDHHAA